MNRADTDFKNCYVDNFYNGKENIQIPFAPPIEYFGLFICGTLKAKWRQTARVGAYPEVTLSLIIEGGENVDSRLTHV